MDAVAGTNVPTSRLGQTSNPNRDWAAQTWSEVRALDAFIRSNVAAGRKYLLGLDLHNGWSQPKVSGACYTVLPPNRADESLITEQKRFIDFMYARTDHEVPGRYWAHDAEGTLKQYLYDRRVFLHRRVFKVHGVDPGGQSTRTISPRASSALCRAVH